MQIEKEAKNILRNLGVNSSYIGFHYVAYGIAIAIKNPYLVVHICKGLYVEIAIHFHTSVTNVERNMRTVVNLIWKNGNTELLNEIFEKEITSRPNNTVFVDGLSHYISNHCLAMNQYTSNITIS